MSADVLIIGAGLAGLALAEALSSDDPDLSILMLEGSSMPAGASQYAGAIDIPIAETPLQRSLIDANTVWWSDLIARYPNAAKLRRDVQLEWSVPCAGADALLECIYPPGRLSVRTRKRSLESTLVGACSTIDAQGLLRLLWDQAQLREQVVADSEVTAIRAQEDHVEVVTRDGRKYSGSRVVVAIGPWLPSALRASHGLRPTAIVRTKRVVGFRFEATGLPRDRAFADLARGVFVFPRSEGFAASVRHDQWDVSPTEAAPPAAARQLLVEYIAELGGTAGDVSPYVFADTYSTAEDPLIGRTPECERVFHLGAFQGSGVRLAPGAAHALAKHLLALQPRKVAQ